MQRLRYAAGLAVGPISGTGIGFAAGSSLPSVFLASIVTLAAFYMIWEARTLGADAADLPRREDSGGAAPHSGVTADIDGGGCSFGG